MRHKTKEIQIGKVTIGGTNPIAIQSMTNTKTEDVKATVSQILQLEKAGCEIIRCAIPTMEAAKSLEINLSEKDRKLIQDLMAKISKLDLNIDSLKTQAKDLYDKLSNIKIDQGVWDSIVQFFKNIWDAIVNFFTNLFGGGNNAEEPTTLAETTTAAEITAEPEQTTTAASETEPAQNTTVAQEPETQISATEESSAETTTVAPVE